MTEKELSHCIEFTKVVAGRPFRALIAADKDELVTLAKRLKLLSMQSFQATLEVNYDKTTHIFIVDGAIEAEFEQECAVSLEHIPQKLSFDFTERLIRPKYYNESDYANADLDEEPEIYDADELDLADIAIQVLALNIPDFPRKEGVEIDKRYTLSEEEQMEQEKKRNPFAMLEKLKKNDN